VDLYCGKMNLSFGCVPLLGDGGHFLNPQPKFKSRDWGKNENKKHKSENGKKTACVRRDGHGGEEGGSCILEGSMILLELYTMLVPVIFSVSVFTGIRYCRYRYFSVGIVVL
jgi:hypothetical protein